MQTNRCPTCGLVNPRELAECRRCHAQLGVPPAEPMVPAPGFPTAPQFPFPPPSGFAPPAPGQPGAQWPPPPGGFAPSAPVQPATPWAGAPGHGAPGGFANAPRASSSSNTTTIVLVGCAGIFVFTVVLGFLIIAAGRSSGVGSSKTTTPGESAPKKPAPSSSSGSPSIERTFEIPMPGGATTAYAGALQPNGRRLVLFDPSIAADDGLIAIAATLTCRELFGSHRGILAASDATLSYDSTGGGNCMVWQIEDPRERFCLLPVKESGTGRIRAAWVWTD